MNCPYCNSENTTKKGWRRLVSSWRQRYRCNDCYRKFTPKEEDTKLPEKAFHNGPRILVLDVETAPMKVYAFQLKTDYIPVDSIITPTFMLCWSAMWLDECRVKADVVTPEEAVSGNDKRICESIHKLMCEADIIIAYNGIHFDLPKINYRFIVNKLSPPSAYRVIDPIKVLRSKFAFDSNKLDHVNGQLMLDQKIKTDFALWIACSEGNKKALKEMVDYNKHDVEVLKQNYLAVRSWMPATLHPNIAVYFEAERMMCRICGSENVHEVLDKYAYTNLGMYSLYRCDDCHAENQGRENLLSKEKRTLLIK